MSDNQGSEKGFNDDELADIMNEIESLEKDFEEVEKVEAKGEETIVEEPSVEEPVAHEEVESAGEPEPEIHFEKEEKEVFEELVELPESKAVPHIAPAPHPKENVAEIKPMPAPSPTPEIPSGHPAHTAMSFKVEGEMKLSMSFWVSGKEFKVWVDEHEGFVIQLDGGAEFKVPVHAPNKKVA